MNFSSSFGNMHVRNIPMLFRSGIKCLKFYNWLVERRREGTELIGCTSEERWTDWRNITVVITNNLQSLAGAGDIIGGGDNRDQCRRLLRVVVVACCWWRIIVSIRTWGRGPWSRRCCRCCTTSGRPTCCSGTRTMTGTDTQTVSGFMSLGSASSHPPGQTTTSWRGTSPPRKNISGHSPNTNSTITASQFCFPARYLPGKCWVSHGRGEPRKLEEFAKTESM